MGRRGGQALITLMTLMNRDGKVQAPRDVMLTTLVAAATGAGVFYDVACLASATRRYRQTTLVMHIRDVLKRTYLVPGIS